MSWLPNKYVAVWTKIFSDTILITYCYNRLWGSLDVRWYLLLCIATTNLPNPIDHQRSILACCEWRWCLTNIRKRFPIVWKMDVCIWVCRGTSCSKVIIGYVSPNFNLRAIMTCKAFFPAQIRCLKQNQTAIFCGCLNLLCLQFYLYSLLEERISFLCWNRLGKR